MAITKATPTSVFNGQCYIIIFDGVADYSVATLGSITANGFDVGQVYQGSTSWMGEDGSFEDELDEQGDINISNPTKGTAGFDFEMADFSAEKFKTFFKSQEITTVGTGSALGESISAVAAGDEIPVIDRPIELINDTSKRAIFFPKARILTGPSMENKLFVLKASVKAQDCNIAGKLGTMMLIDKVALNFTRA